jgi:hypothetical protein
MTEVSTSLKLSTLVKIAESFIGVKEQGNNRGGMVEEFQKAVDGKANGEPWCMGFAQYCIQKAEAVYFEKSGIFPSESVYEVWNRSPLDVRSPVPVPGSLMLWQFWRDGHPTRMGHVGIVKQVYENGFLDVIEGNTTQPGGATLVIRDGDGVYLKRRTNKGSSQMRILGYLTPFQKSKPRTA